MAQAGTNIDLSRASWHKSTHSNGGEGGCVEVADNLPGIVVVRDSKDSSGPSLVFGPDAWRVITRDVKHETYELR